MFSIHVAASSSCTVQILILKVTIIDVICTAIYYRHVFFENWPSQTPSTVKILNKRSIKFVRKHQATTPYRFVIIALDTIRVLTLSNARRFY